jgi:hypothetical protein
MANDFKPLYQGQPGTAAEIIYTAPAGFQAAVKEIRMINMSNSTAVRIGLFQGGLAAINRVFPDMPLHPGEMAIDAGLKTLDEGHTIGAIASIAGLVTVTIYGVELSI